MADSMIPLISSLYELEKEISNREEQKNELQILIDDLICQRDRIIRRLDYSISQIARSNPSDHDH